jgi:hypothetical protein
MDLRVGRIGKLINANYQDVARVTLSAMEPWPESILYQGRVFLLYSVARPVGAVDDTEMYREVSCFKVPA